MGYLCRRFFVYALTESREGKGHGSEGRYDARPGVKDKAVILVDDGHAPCSVEVVRGKQGEEI